MPPKFKFTREEIIKAALDMTRERGIASVTARGLAARLGSSAKPIFGLFRNMEEVCQEVLSAANQRYQDYLKEGMAAGKYPPYKASGMAYIRFAGEEKELFKLLFMRDRSEEEKLGAKEGREEIRPLLTLIQKNTGLGEEEAYLFHLEMWVFVHGIAAMIATSYLEWEMDFIDKVLTDGYLGMKSRFCREEAEETVPPQETEDKAKKE